MGTLRVLEQRRIKRLRTKILREVASGHVDDGVLLARETLRRYPDEVGLWLLLETVLAFDDDRGENLAEREGVLRDGLDSVPGDVRLRVNLIDVLSAEGKIEEADALLDELAA